MVSPAVPVGGPRLRHSVAWTRTVFQHLVVPLVAALPLALIAAPSVVVRVFGWTYATIWAAFVIPHSTAMVWMIIDALLMLSGRSPAFLPNMVASRRMRGYLTRRIVVWVNGYARIATVIGPLSNTAFAVMLAALRLRPEIAAEAFKEAERLEHLMSQAVTTVEPSTALSGPVIDQVEAYERELAAVA